jgi:hypothetical protein
MRTSWREPLVFASIKSPCVDVVRVYDESLASREGGGSHEGLWAERFLISLDELFLAMRTDPPGPVFRDGQDAAGHADPRTTRRYERARHNLDRHPMYALAGLVSDTAVN